MVTEPTWVYLAGGGLLPVLGGAAGAMLPWLAQWWSGLRWVPLRGPASLVASAPRPAAVGVAVLLGVVTGAVAAYQWYQQRLVVTVSPTRLELAHPGRTLTEVSRGHLTAVFREAGELVLLGPDTGELGRYPGDLPWIALARALREHGYPWCPDGDPHRDSYRRWVPGVGGLPPAAEPLLRARERALSRRDRADADELRTELGRLGVVMRDEHGRQYWRLTTGEGP